MILRLPARRVLPWLALTLGACDLRNPASPFVSPVAALPAGGEVKHAESALVGSFSAPNTVPQPGERTSYFELSASGTTLEPNTYTLIRVGGTLKVRGNPYNPAKFTFNASYSAVESGQSTGRGSTNVWLRESGSALPAGLQKVSYFFRPDGGGRDLVLLVRTGDKAVEMWAEREMMPGASKSFGYCMPGFPYCDSEHVVQPDSSVLKDYIWIEDFWIAESHKVTATRLSDPLVVDGPAVVAPGGTASFEARPWGDLRLRDRNGSPSDVRWMWFPNDTTGTPPPNSNPRIICSGQAAGTCAFEPKESGRLHVWSDVEGALVQTNKIVRVQQQRVQLTCPASVQRGSTMTCTAAAVPSGTLDSVQWTFVDTAGNTVRDSLRLSWDGRMVVGGRMSVTAKLNGSPVAADTPVGITHRTWPQITVIAADSGHGDLPHHPRVMHDLAHTHAPSKANPHDTELISDGGPNAGWWYVKNPITQARAVVHISSGFKPGTPFYQLQHSGVDPVTKDPFCSKGQLPRLERGARQHEGLLSSSITSHIEVYELWFRTNSPQAELERYVLHQNSMPAGNLTFSDMVDNQFDRHISRPAHLDPNQRHASETPPGLVPFPSVPCRPRFFP